MNMNMFRTTWKLTEMPLVIPVEGAGLRVVSGLVATAAAVRLFLVVALHLLGGALHAPAHAIECLVLVWGWWGVVVVIGVGSVSVKVVGLGVYLKQGGSITRQQALQNSDQDLLLSLAENRKLMSLW